MVKDIKFTDLPQNFQSQLNQWGITSANTMKVVEKDDSSGTDCYLIKDTRANLQVQLQGNNSYIVAHLKDRMNGYLVAATADKWYALANNNSRELEFIGWGADGIRIRYTVGPKVDHIQDMRSYANKDNSFKIF